MSGRGERGARARSLSRCRPALGTYVRIRVAGEVGDDDLLAASQAAFGEIDRIERLLSFHHPESDLHRLHREAALKAVEVPAETAEVLALALDLGRRTDGAFDPTIAGRRVALGLLPDHGFDYDPEATIHDVELEARRVRFTRPLLLDFGGIAKGYAVDRALAAIPAHLEAVVDAGGDLKMRPWRGRAVGVRPPALEQAVGIHIAGMRAAAVATSAATYGDGVHAVRDPRTGAATTPNGSVSVFAPSCALADALTKVALLVPAGHPLWRELAVSVLWVEPDGSSRWRAAG